MLQPGSVPVEGFSNPTWVAVLAVGRALHLFDHGAWFGTPDLVLYPKLVALLCCFGVFALMFSIARTVSRRPVADHPRRGHGHRGGAVVRHLDHERFGERALRTRGHGDRRRPCAHGGVWSAARLEKCGGGGDPRGARGADPARRHRLPRRISHRDRPHRRARDGQAHRESEPDLVGGLRDSGWCLSDVAATHLRRLSAQHRTCQGARSAEHRRSGQAGVTRRVPRVAHHRPGRRRDRRGDLAPVADSHSGRHAAGSTRAGRRELRHSAAGLDGATPLRDRGVAVGGHSGDVVGLPCPSGGLHSATTRGDHTRNSRRGPDPYRVLAPRHSVQVRSDGGDVCRRAEHGLLDQRVRRHPRRAGRNAAGGRRRRILADEPGCIWSTCPAWPMPGLRVSGRTTTCLACATTCSRICGRRS